MCALKERSPSPSRREGAPAEARSTESVAERPFKEAKAGPPQLGPLESLLERETSHSTEATARQRLVFIIPFKGQDKTVGY